MFKWEVKEMKLKDIDMSKSWNCLWENKISKEDKIAFIDKMNNGKMTYLLNLINKFNKDKDTLKFDSYGYVKTVSLKAWLKRNDDKEMVDNYYHYGYIRFLNCERNILHINEKFMYDMWDDYVDEIFHRQMIQCKQVEIAYFKQHDELEVLKSQVMEYFEKYRTDFGNKIWYCSDGRIGVRDENDLERELTKEELTEMVNGYKKLEKYIETLSSEINIEY